MKNKKKTKKESKQSVHGPFTKSSKFIYLLILLIVPLILYFRVVHFDRSDFDDGQIIGNINNVQGSPLNIIEAFKHDAFMGNNGDTFYRPLQTISFMIDARIGGKDPWIYHLSNLLLHLLTIIALFFFLIKTGIRKEISFILALFFSIHPLFTNAVAWIPARGDILLCLFSLLSFITFLDYYNSRKTIILVLHILAFLPAVFAKETAVILPVIILSYIYFVKKEKFIFRYILPVLIVWIISFVLFFSLRQGVIKIVPNSNVLGIIPFIKNLPVIPITFCKLFIPYSLSTMPFFENMGIILGNVLLTLFTVASFKIIKGDNRSIIWGGLWFLAFSIPSMFYKSYFATIGFDYFEYRTYLPMVGVLIIIGLLISDLSTGEYYKKILLISVPIFIIYVFITINHLADFANPVSFFTSAIKTNPTNSFALGERGTAYFYRGRQDSAMSDFNSAITACSTYSMPYFNKGLIYSSRNDHIKAEYYFTLALNFDTLTHGANPLGSDTYEYLSLEKNTLRKYDDSKIILKKGISLYPNNSRLHNLYGLAFYNKSQFDSSLYEYNRAIEYDKTTYSYYDNRGMAKYHLDDNNGALIDFNKALELKPNFSDSWGNRGLTKIKLNDYEGAISDLTNAIRFNSGARAAYYFRGIAYSRLNMANEAEADWKKAAELGY